jgi:hypothetical protein
MRTTITFDPDVTAAVEQMRRERSIGVSQAVNELVRAGLRARPAQRRFRQRSVDLGLRIDVTNIGDVLDLLDHD